MTRYAPSAAPFPVPSNRPRPSPMTAIAYKIEDRATLDAALAAGRYDGSELDRADGFIHLSTAAQTRETLSKWFSGRAGLALATVDLAALGAAVRWETSRGGELFPHVYGPLPAAAVMAVVDLPVDADGAHVLPPGFDGDGAGHGAATPA